MSLRLTSGGILRSWTLLANVVYVGFMKTSGVYVNNDNARSGQWRPTRLYYSKRNNITIGRLRQHRQQSVY